MNPQQFSLRWNNYTSYIAGAFDSLRYEEDFVDVTLCCEGRKIRAHKILLSACSPYFKDVFKENPCQHPVIIFKNVRYTDLMSLVEFMYQGEVSVPQEQLPSFLHTAEILAIRGLTDNTSDSRQPASTTTSAIAQQLIQSQAVLDKSATITTTDSLYLTLPSNSTIVHQPKLVQQIQTAPIITKPLIKSAPPEMPALAASTTTLAVPIAQQQQQPTIAKIQVQASPQQQQQQPVQVQQVAVQQVAVQQQVQQTQQSQQNQQQTTSQVQSQPQHQTTQATTLQEVVDNVVQPRKKKIKGQQITSQSNTSVPSGSTVTVTSTTSGQSGENEIYETETYTLATNDGRVEQKHAEQYTENGQTSGSALKMEIPEFISVGEPINSGNGSNNTYLQESYELVPENIEEKDEDEDMAQDNIEIEGSEMDMSRIFQGSTDEQTKSNILQDTELRFRCSICWKGFKHPMSLTLHKDLHSGKTKCPVCLRSFSRSYDMRIHLNKIHQVTLKLDARFNFKNMKSE
ncbi:longitudinals lacking protein, isoforms A/B/D/L-like isoform X4 [Anopheles moucheti]|uniref:longitudinals lacking protein, isoforms A/B/D/L-like isoform X4 n=1 Tax=Anopheles moucheti TaxID=186751 RepID=UPI0022F04A4F|nr:longitudinals lacking protein, isoforms A/B/D/L-like isoform X4 [Anopheles moucheti]